METLRKILIGVVMMFGLWSIQLSGNLHTRTKRPISLRSMLESSLYLHLPTSGDNLCAASKLNPPSIRLSGTGAESHARAEPSATSAGIRASNDQPAATCLSPFSYPLPYPPTRGSRLLASCQGWVFYFSTRQESRTEKTELSHSPLSPLSVLFFSASLLD
jgi:hypothetical protein